MASVLSDLTPAQRVQVGKLSAGAWAVSVPFDGRNAILLESLNFLAGILVILLFLSFA
jgi:hypothetical protein